MKILVTGATGFIGSHLIRELLKDKSNQVVATSRDAHKANKFDWFSKVEYIQYDLNDNIDKDLYDFFGKPDRLINVAWGGLSNLNNLEHIEITLFNHYKFIKHMVIGGLKDVVFTGTCYEYGMAEGCLSEDMYVNPSTMYAVAKDTLRKFIVGLEKQYEFTYKWIRLFYVYGEGQAERSLIYLLNEAIHNKDKEFNMSGGEQIRDFLHIDEVVKNIILITNQDIYINQPINCCSGEPISIKDLIKTYLKEKKYNIKLNLGYYPYVDYEPMVLWGNNCKLEKIKIRQKEKHIEIIS